MNKPCNRPNPKRGVTAPYAPPMKAHPKHRGNNLFTKSYHIFAVKHKLRMKKTKGKMH